MEKYIYETMMTITPEISKEYLTSILFPNSQEKINRINIDEVVESNTSLIIKFSIQVLQNNREFYKKKFFIKTVNNSNINQTYNSLGEKEASFYQLINRLKITNLPIVKSYDIYISENKEKYFILLEDISDEYKIPCNSDLLLNDIWLMSASSLAKVHSRFWNIGNVDSFGVSTERIEDIENNINKTYDSFGKFKKYTNILYTMTVQHPCLTTW